MISTTGRARLDLAEPKLLLLFDALWRTRSVTRAAQALGQEQPTVSVWLGKLRARLGDPLFVRAPGGMQPTPRAEALAGPVRAALDALRALDGGAPAFDPSTAARTFRLLMTDAAHVTMLPPLLAHVRAEAPGVALDVDALGADAAQSLADGTADLALGFLPDLPGGYYQQALFAQDFVCLVGARHPVLAAGLTLRQYREASHVALVLEGTGHAIVDRALVRQRVARLVRLRLPGFLGLATLVSTSDLVATVPRGIGEALVRQAPLVLHPCPVRIPSYVVRQHWHTRMHDDAGHRWLRGVCARLFGDRAPRSGRRVG